MIELVSKLGEINDIDHNKGSKIYPQNRSYFRLYYAKMDMVLGKKVAIFGWEWGRISAPRDGQKILCPLIFYELLLCWFICYLEYYWEIPTTHYLWHKNLVIIKD